MCPSPSRFVRYLLFALLCACNHSIASVQGEGLFSDHEDDLFNTFGNELSTPEAVTQQRSLLATAGAAPAYPSPKKSPPKSPKKSPPLSPAFCSKKRSNTYLIECVGKPGATWGNVRDDVARSVARTYDAYGPRLGYTIVGFPGQVPRRGGRPTVYTLIVTTPLPDKCVTYLEELRASLRTAVQVLSRTVTRGGTPVLTYSANFAAVRNKSGFYCYIRNDPDYGSRKKLL